MKKAEIDINNLPPLSRRLYQFAIENAGSIYAFAKNIELSQPRVNSLFHVSEKTGKYPTIQSDVIEAILKKYDLNTNWLYTGSGSMLKNISENSENLLKQIKNDERNNNSIETIIMDLVKKTVMEQIPAIIKAVGEAMREARKDENKNIQAYLENQKEISSMQMDVFRDIVKILSKSEPKDAKEIEDKLFKINTKIA